MKNALKGRYSTFHARTSGDWYDVFRQEAPGNVAVADEPVSGRFDDIVLNGLTFGNYSLLDPTSTDVANSNVPSDFEEFDLPQYDSNSLARTVPQMRTKRPFVLDDDLEAEAIRRRLNQPIRIPERRFGQHLSHDFSLRFRFFTSWHQL